MLLIIVHPSVTILHSWWKPGGAGSSRARFSQNLRKHPYLHLKAPLLTCAAYYPWGVVPHSGMSCCASPLSWTGADLSVYQLLLGYVELFSVADLKHSHLAGQLPCLFPEAPLKKTVGDVFRRCMPSCNLPSPGMQWNGQRASNRSKARQGFQPWNQTRHSQGTEIEVMSYLWLAVSFCPALPLPPPPSFNNYMMVRFPYQPHEVWLCGQGLLRHR